VVSRDWEDPLNDRVRQFLWGSIDSVMQLEALLLLHAHPQREWTAEEIAGELRSDPTGARQQLAPLITRGLLRLNSPADPAAKLQYAVDHRSDLHVRIGQVADAYTARRVTVITLIYSRPPAASPPTAPAETDPVREFAEAFRLRRAPPPKSGPNAEGDEEQRP
jgi:hypothetical protein